MRIVVDAETDVILGATIMGTSGDGVIFTLLDLITAGGNAALLRQTMHINPARPSRC